MCPHSLQDGCTLGPHLPHPVPTARGIRGKQNVERVNHQSYGCDDKEKSQPIPHHLHEISPPNGMEGDSDAPLGHLAIHWEANWADGSNCVSEP